MNVEVFNQIYAEEKASVPNRSTLGSAAVSQLALAPTLVRYINLVVKGSKDGNDKRSSDKPIKSTRRN